MIVRWLLVIVLGAAVLVPAATAGSSAARVIDRTFVCETGYLGGVYQIDVEGHWYAAPGSQRRRPFAGASTNLTDGTLGGMSSSSIYVNRLHCTSTAAKLALTARELRGGPVPPLGIEYDCFTSRRVLLRVRGEFLKPTTLKTASPFGYPQLQALGPTKHTQLAVGTLAGRPIAYISIAGATKARLFTSSNCKED